MAETGARAVVVIAANTAWNLVNFRSGLIAALIARGYDVVAAAPSDPIAQAGLAALGARFAPVPIDGKGISPAQDLRTMLAFRNLFRTERPVCFLGYTVKPNVYGSLAARLCSVPAINNISGLGTAFIAQTWLTPVVETLYRVGLASAHRVFFQNADDLALFLDRRLIRPAAAQLLPGSGIDLSAFTTAPPEAAPDAPTFLLIARMVRDKGVVEYAEAARNLRARHPAWRFRIVGFLDVANRTAIERATVDAWVAAGDIEFLGPAADVRPHIAAATCVVLPSYREGTSRVLLEAAAMARPIVTTDVPGCREVVDDGINGYLCRPRDAASLADAMERMGLASPAAHARMGAAGRAKVEAEFDERIVIDRYLAAIEAAPAARARLNGNPKTLSR